MNVNEQVQDLLRRVARLEERERRLLELVTALARRTRIDDIHEKLMEIDTDA